MKNFLAVVAGLAFVVVALSYRLVIAVGGGWITARLAQSRAMLLAIVLGIIGTVVGLAGLAAAWMMRPSLGPLWYPTLLVVTAIPCTWLGGKLAAARAAPAQ